MSLWIVDGGIGLTLPVVARVDDWQENDHIDVTGADENGEWLSEHVRYVKERGTCHNADIGTEGYFKCSECSASCSVDWECSGWDVPRFCPNCGAKVVDE